MRNITKLEEKLNNGEIDDCELDILIAHYKEKGDKIWNNFIQEEDMERRKLLREQRDEWEKRDTDFLKVLIEFLVFKYEK